MIFFFIHLPPEFLPVLGPFTLGAAMLCSSMRALIWGLTSVLDPSLNSLRTMHKCHRIVVKHPAPCILNSVILFLVSSDRYCSPEWDSNLGPKAFSLL